MTFRLVESSGPGPDPNYSDEDMFWAMHLMSMGRSISRSALSRDLGVGEGTVKNILAVLKDADLTITFHTGTRLNDLGMELMALLPMVPADMELPQSLPGPFRQSVIVKTASVDPMSLEDSDDAVGCSVMVQDGGDARCFGMQQSSAESVFKAVSEASDPFHALVIGYGDTLQEARNRAIHLALRFI